MNLEDNITGIDQTALKEFLQTGVLRLLLAGMYFMFGIAGSRRELFRDMALRLRRVETGVSQVGRSLRNAENHINAWSGDKSRHWRTRLLALSVDPQAPDIRFTSRNIVCRLRNAAASKLRPRHHSHSYLAMTSGPCAEQDIFSSMTLCSPVKARLDSRDQGVRAPP